MTEPDSWDAAAKARMSDRWTEQAAHWNTAMTGALLSAAALTPHSVVMDLAAGSGDPALTIAEHVTRGRVIAVDSSRAGLLLAGRQARRLGFGQRVAFVQADAHAIPLAADSVDRITCRCGIMFFNDAGRVMSEALRVLMPGGRAAFLVWGAFEQPFFEATVGIVLRLLQGAAMPAQASEMFRFAVPGSLGSVLRAAGFRDVHERTLTVHRVWSGAPEELWVYQQEISTLCHPLFDSIPADSRPIVDAQVIAALSRFQSGDVLSVPVNVIVVSGQRS
jgi:ubiquinone/menaquinone biosynthesis C-methylase UbiE